MADEENKIDGLSSHPKSSEERARSRKKMKKRQLEDSVKTEDEQEVIGDSPQIEGNSRSADMSIESRKKKIKKNFVEETVASDEGSKKSGGRREKKGKKNTECFPEEVNRAAESGNVDREKLLLKETSEAEDEQEVNAIIPVEVKKPKPNDEMVDRLKKKKKRLLKEAAKADKRGVCYLSRIPPHMDDVKLRQILSQYGEIERIYLVPKGPTAQVHRKRSGGFQVQEFSEGWVEFTNKIVAKRVANMLNGEQIGGRKRSKFFYDHWNIKYLSKFKWDDLTEEIAYKRAVREQKFALELSAAKRERDFYLNKVDKAHALSSIEERLKKKQKVQQESAGQLSTSEQVPKVIRQFPQTKPVADKAEERKSQLSKDILAGVFGGS